MEERLLKISECQRVLGLGRSKVMGLLSSGELPSLTIGRSRRVMVSALSRFIEQREAASRSGTGPDADVHDPVVAEPVTNGAAAT